MKFRKLLSLFVILVCIAAFVAPTYAAVINLPVPPPCIATDAEQGWATDGVDSIASELIPDNLHSAKYLVLELGVAPTGMMQFIWIGNGDNWLWTPSENVIPFGGTKQTIIVIDIPQTAKNYKAFLRSTELKIFLGYYDKGISDLKIKKAYLITDTVNASDSKALISAAKKNGTAVLDFAFDFSALDLDDLYDISEVKVARTALSQLANAKLNVSINMRQGSVYFDSFAAKVAAKAAKETNITITLKEADYFALTKAEKEKVKPSDIVYHFSMMSGKNPVTGITGTAQLRIPYDGPTPAPSYIWLINHAGDLVKTKCTYDAKTKELVVDLSEE